MGKKTKKPGAERRENEEFAFDLTPDVRDGRTTRMHPNRSRTLGREQGERNGGEEGLPKD